MKVTDLTLKERMTIKMALDLLARQTGAIGTVDFTINEVKSSDTALHIISDIVIKLAAAEEPKK
jgi:hypothetical protein